MMLNKSDGSLYSAETIAEMMDARFERNEFANVSDLLGADWGMSFPAARSAAEYQSQARARAAAIYRVA
jgi:hypothetical protein